MKKRSLLLIIMGIFGLIFIPCVYAAEIDFGSAVTDTNNKNIKEIPLTLNVEEGDEISTIKLKCNTSNGDVNCSFVSSDYFTAQENVFAYIEDSKIPVGSVSLGTLKLENPTTSKLNDVKVSVEYTINDEKKSTSEKSYELAAKVEEVVASSNAKLSSVSVNRGTMYPEFSQDVTEYTIYDIKDTLINITFSTGCAEGGCSVEVSGGTKVSNRTVDLAIGENTIYLTSTSEDKINKETYKFTVYRGETSFNSADLKSLSIDGYTLSPSFSKDVTSYSVKVTNKVVSLYNILKYETVDSGITPSVEGTDDLKVGDNTVTITLKNFVGDQEKKYTITVTRMSDDDIEITKYINNEITYKNSNGEESTLSLDEFKVLYSDEYKKITNKEIVFDENGLVKVEENVTTTTTSIVEDNNSSSKSSFKFNKKVIIIIAIITGGLILIVVAAIIIFGKKKDIELDENVTNKEDTNNDITLDNTKEYKVTQETTSIEIASAINDLMVDSDYEFEKEDESDKDE